MILSWAGSFASPEKAIFLPVKEASNLIVLLKNVKARFLEIKTINLWFIVPA
jgi:hypothetical protein